MHRDPNHAAYAKGDKLFKQGRFGDAAKLFRLAAEAWPEDWQAYWALGNCYSEIKKATEGRGIIPGGDQACSRRGRSQSVFQSRERVARSGEVQGGN
jgi:tetratricopeptide (TPR) repeat protein